MFAAVNSLRMAAADHTAEFSSYRGVQSAERGGPALAQARRASGRDLPRRSARFQAIVERIWST